MSSEEAGSFFSSTWHFENVDVSNESEKQLSVQRYEREHYRGNTVITVFGLREPGGGGQDMLISTRLRVTEVGALKVY